MLLNIRWTRGPSGVYQSQGDGRYTLIPVGGGRYAVQVWGETVARVDALDVAKNWCEQHRHAGKPEAE